MEYLLCLVDSLLLLVYLLCLTLGINPAIGVFIHPAASAMHFKFFFPASNTPAVYGGVSTLQIADNKHERMMALSQARAPPSFKRNQAIMQLAAYLHGFIKRWAVQQCLQGVRLGLTAYHLYASH